MNEIPDMGSIRSVRSELADAVAGFHEFAQSKIEPAMLELCRLRIVQIHDGLETVPETDATRAAGITEAQLRELANWRDSDQFSEAEKACLELSEYFCYSAQSVTDEHVDEVARHLTAEQILTLTTSYWATDASHRLDNFLSSLEVSRDHN